MLLSPCKVEMPVTDEAVDLEGDEEPMEFTEHFGRSVRTLCQTHSQTLKVFADI